MKPGTARNRSRSLDRVIRRIKAEPWTTIPELAEFVKLSPRRIAAWLMVLEAAGCVVRQRCWDNARHSWVISVRWMGQP